MSTVDSGLDDLITRVKASGGSEIANTQPFIVHLCQALGLAPPEFSTSANRFNDYVFERRVDFKHPDGSTTPGRIDLYNVTRSVEPDAAVSTSELYFYGLLAGDGFEPGAVKHGAKEYSNYGQQMGDKHHLNNVESFWRLFKRSVASTRIHVSERRM